MAAVLGVASGCADDLPDRLPGCLSEPPEINPEGEISHWVVDSVTLPVSQYLLAVHSLNLDCDPRERLDNGVGHILSLIQQYEGSSLNGEVDNLLRAGRPLQLLSLQATSLDDAAGVGATLLHGIDLDDDPSDNFSGSEPFGIDTATGQGTVSGQIVAGHLSAHGGQLPIGLILPGLGDVVVLPVEAGRIEMTIGGRIEGTIAGIIPGDALDRVLIPFLHLGLVRAIERDCAGSSNGWPPCNCTADSFGATLVEGLDWIPDRPGTEPDGDCELDLEEFRESLAANLLAPDIDAFDQDGTYSPRMDGVKDSMSLGIGFTAVPAVAAP